MRIGGDHRLRVGGTVMSAHTPTPWIVRTQVRVGPYRGGHYLARNDTESATAWAKDEANAAFIVKCVNSHDALVKKLEEIHDITQDTTLGVECWQKIQNIEATAASALASIKETAK